jgi:hypothetical protein
VRLCLRPSTDGMLAVRVQDRDLPGEAMSIPDDIVIADQREALAALAAERDSLRSRLAAAEGQRRSWERRAYSSESDRLAVLSVNEQLTREAIGRDVRLAAADALLKDIRNVGIVQGTSDRIDAHLAGAGIVGTVMLKP